MSKSKSKSKGKTRKQNSRPGGKPGSARIRSAGQPMRFCANLGIYLKSLPADDLEQGNFRLGDWLAALDAETLHDLRGEVRRMLSGVRVSDAVEEDLVTLSIHVVGFERGVDEVEADASDALGFIKGLHMAADVEHMRRAGLLVPDGRISIESPLIGAHLTDDGKAVSGQLAAGTWLN